MATWRPRGSFVEDILGVKEREFRDSDDLLREALPAPSRLRNRQTGQEWGTGTLEMPTLGTLRAQPISLGGAGRGFINVLCGANDLSKVDVGYLQAHPENQGALFQVASNFNGLELMNKHDSRAMSEVGNYVFDRTQGPFASISAAPGLLLRHYYPFWQADTSPQTWRQVYDGRQVQLLERLGYAVTNGYLDLRAQDLESQISLDDFQVAHHRDVQVTFGQVKGSEHEVVTHPQNVSQVFTATADLAQTNRFLYQDHPEQVKALVKNLLRGAYEGTLRAAVTSGVKRVYLTLIGGGVFANPPAWIVDVLEEQLDLITESGLSVVVNTYRGIGDRQAFDRLIALARKTGGDLLLV